MEMAEHPDLQPTELSLGAARKRSIRRALDEAHGAAYRPRTSSRHDLLHQLDWLRDGWGDDEWKVAKRLSRLKRSILELLIEPAQGRALECHSDLCRARIVSDSDWRSVIVRLGLIVSRAAPRKELVCGFKYAGFVCQIRLGSEAARVEHRVTVHGQAFEEYDRELRATA